MSETSIIDTIMSRLPKETARVLASTQYHLGFIITDGNKIVFRDDSISHAEREAMAAEVNTRINQMNSTQEHKVYKCSHALEQQLLRWALGGETGRSSMFMAGVAAFGRRYKPGKSTLPGDYGDLRRCVAMANSCASFSQALPELRRVSPMWDRFVDRWEDMKRLVESDYNSNTAYPLYAEMRAQIETPTANE